LRTFIAGQLKPLYQVYTAENGEEAMKILEQETVNMVITDIIMPVMDGLELCRTLRSDLNFSHIPIIVLTAKTALPSVIEGYDAGADAYIEKPFAMELLLAQIANLFANRKKLKEAFINTPYINIGMVTLSKPDEQFLKNVTDVILKNLAEVSFNVEDLAEQLNMSRSSLHRKIKGVTELTPNDFIQLVRLKKAAEYLKEEAYRVNEVSYIVGFSSSSYFSKVFKKQFGVLPKEFVQQNKRRMEN
jgi:YesN/AraC family two-component response regulator